MALFAMLTLAASIGPIAWLVRTRIAGALEWLVSGAAAAAMCCAALIVGPWALLSVRLRPFIAVAMLAALAAAWYRASRAAASPHRLRMPTHRLARRVGVACLFGLAAIDGCAGRLVPNGAIDLRFPLEEGAYAVIQSGNSLLTNPFHHWFPSDRYGVDLVNVNAFGNRARGIAPSRLNDYASYDVAVHSPCTGVVDEVVGNIADNAPGQTDPQHISGNHVVLRCGPLRVLLAHMRAGSVAVAAGATVRSGQIVGRIGNSGNTNEPHLHVGAVSAGSTQAGLEAAGVPITFGGRFLVINDVIR